jgi:membrane protease YdiL (CAAX protease family)
MESQNTNQRQEFPETDIPVSTQYIPNIPTLKELSLVLLATIGIMILAAVSFIILSLKYSIETEFLLTEVLLVVPALIFTTTKGYSIPEIFRLHSVKGREMRFAVISGVALILIINYIENLLQLIPLPEKFIEQKQLFEQGLFELLRITNLYNGVIIIAAVVIVAGLAEEMLFRGFIQRTFEHKVPAFWAIAVTAVIFTGLHPFSLIPILLLAGVLGIISWRSNSIVPAVIIHCANNGLSLYALNTNLEIQTDPIKGVEISFPVFAISVVIFILSFRYYFLESAQTDKDTDESHTDETFEKTR